MTTCFESQIACRHPLLRRRTHFVRLAQEETPGILTVSTHVIPHLAYPTAYEHTFCKTTSTHSGAGD